MRGVQALAPARTSAKQRVLLVSVSRNATVSREGCELCEAGTLLDQAGWTLSGGKRKKDGEELNIRLVAYPHRPGLVIMQPIIADALTNLGINVETILTSDNGDLAEN